MTPSDDIDALAAEYVLGTLDATERATVAARRSREPALDRAIGDWEVRLGPLSTMVPPLVPSDGLFAEIERRLDRAAADAGGSADTRLVDLTRRLRRWRTAAVAFGALAAGLAVGIGLRETAMRSEPRSFVAVLQKDAASPAFIVSVDLDTRSLTVRPVAAEPQPGKSYELWLINDALGTPRSLGVIGQEPFTVRPALAKYDPKVVETATYAVTLEPQGGSPTGKPTLPPVFVGKLIQATP
ncbi:MAG: anti-sigma factor [Methylobacteriaceae bacterium]|nr:anti-sigma factor [Methylobacteriaceae bacterium]MBV9220061.1 anti-sigma factor [Methylobacteriaceae bacterium]MBV9634555.1 anti-sigma factor [Methylobacteriaceae bacterium]MBV9704979.1 anti-sigma factor [Methylobacteriaceae bacterium]